MPHLTPIQTARAIAKLEENWSLAAVARELHCSKTCILNMKRRWQENRLERPIRIVTPAARTPMINDLI
ncbi:unnamed protein product [Tenebrio molitor]|nr:unnamed protein product [Tenebrio molitor]